MEIFNIIPTHDQNEHMEETNCWCDPVMTYKDALNGNEVWAHNLSGEQ